jgi:protein-S-isoprenylcysteine O-methyltransferase Ste14
MIGIGNFFFKYRNFLFIFLYGLLFVPSPPLFSESAFGRNYWLIPVILGLLITVSGQAIRGATIGLDYIMRGGKEGKVYADDLVTGGMFRHCRNPLYVGNILMLLGVGIISNSLIYILVVMPVFLFIYQSIVLAEENFLRNKFGEVFENYVKKVNRWVPDLRNISNTFGGARFNAVRWMIKEYGTQYVWLTGITLILLFYYPQLTHNNDRLRNILLAVILPLILLGYLFVRYMKKSGKWSDHR